MSVNTRVSEQCRNVASNGSWIDSEKCNMYTKKSEKSKGDCIVGEYNHGNI